MNTLAGNPYRAMYAALALVLAVNAIVLAGAAWNRSGEPESELILTQRELDTPYGGYGEFENSGMTLRLDWKIADADRRFDEDPDAAYYGYGSRTATWLDAEKMRTLGFTPPAPGTEEQLLRYEERTSGREVFLVLELDGPAYRESLAQVGRYVRRTEQQRAANPRKKELAEQAIAAKEMLGRVEKEMSRLFVVDAGLDAEILRGRYRDRTHYAIVRGRVEPMLQRSPDWPDDKSVPEFAGYVDSLSIDGISVPAGVLPSSVMDDEKVTYRVQVAWGRRFEPWIVSAQMTAPQKPAND